VSETPAAIYCRISRDAEDAGLGVARQEKLCRNVCRQHGWPVAEVFTDNDVSAAGRKPRPAFDQLLAAVEDGRFRVVVALDLDRLTRSHKDLLRIVEACTKHGVRVAFEREAGFDPVTGEGMLEIEIRTSVAAEEIRKVRNRVTRQKRERAAKGLPQGGPRPLGYTSSSREKVKPREAKLIREATSRLLHGASQGDVCRWLNDRGYTTAQGHRWTVSRLRKLLMRADVAGRREVRNEQGDVVEVLPASWKPIITPDEHDRLVAILTNVRRHRAPSQYLLTPPEPLAFCVCGAPLYGAGGRDYRIYRCKPEYDLGSASQRGCGGVQVRADWLEEHVVNFALSFATHPDVIASRQEERIRVEGEASVLRAALTKLDVKEQRINDLAADDDGMSPREYRRKMSEVRSEREHLERQLAKVQTAEGQLVESGGYEEARRRWDGLTFNERRVVLRSLLVKVTLRPAGRPGSTVFDPDRVVIQPDWGPLIESAERYAAEHDLAIWS
jgi:site-specific DNA recombinase